VTNDIIQNIILTMSRDTQINTNHIAACLRILNQTLYLASSHAAVTIWNHHRSSRTKVISDNIHKARFINFFIVVSKESHVVSALAVQAIHFISLTQQSSKFAQNQSQFVRFDVLDHPPPGVHHGAALTKDWFMFIAQNHNNTRVDNINNFIDVFILIDLNINCIFTRIYKLMIITI
jgi:hypothetical protein